MTRSFSTFLMSLIAGLWCAANSQQPLNILPDSTAAKLKIGVIQGQHWSSGSATPYYIQKFQNLGFRQVDSISAYTDTSFLRTYDIFYFPLGWCYDTKTRDWVSEIATFFKSFVYEGGYIVLEQPNCSGLLTMLPYPIYLSIWYDTNDYPEIVLDSTHYITRGFRRTQLSFPTDQVDSMDSRYIPLTKGRVTFSPDMICGSYGKGHTFLYLGNTAADPLLYRIMTWNAWEKLFSRRVSFTLVSSSTNTVSDVYLHSPINTILFENNFVNIGKTVDTNYILGDTFVLSIYVHSRYGDFEYYSNSEAAQTIQISNNVWEFRFEDTPEPGKHWDYNDVVVRMTLAEDDTVTTAASSDPLAAADRFLLQQNMPNPFNPSTSIHYWVADPSRVRLEVYTIKGDLVEVLTNEYKQPGTYTVQWNAQNHASGIYCFKLYAGHFVSGRRGVLLK